MNILNFFQTVLGNSDMEMAELFGIRFDTWFEMKKKEVIELSNSEMLLITKKTGISKKYITTRQVVSEFDSILESAKKRFHENEFQNQVEIIKDLLDQSDLSSYLQNVINAIKIFDSSEPNKISHTSIDGLKLLRIDNFDIYQLISEKYDLYDQSKIYDTWVDFINGVINKELGRTLSDNRFISYIDLTKENRPQEVFNLIRMGNIQWDSQIVLDLIEKGAHIIWYFQEKHSQFTDYSLSLRKDVMSTLLLKDYCKKEIALRSK
jgi:hypothetical protein